jgi:hypothetical protein
MEKEVLLSKLDRPAPDEEERQKGNYKIFNLLYGYLFHELTWLC